mmetsp:Transcript_85/g.345  ORF Transcript_85/g.345 Transcript_85/m.345 type:complete len:205 (-) Transcript_85:1608-2222(-)
MSSSFFLTSGHSPERSVPSPLHSLTSSTGSTIGSLASTSTAPNPPPPTPSMANISASLFSPFTAFMLEPASSVPPRVVAARTSSFSSRTSFVNDRISFSSSICTCAASKTISPRSSRISRSSLSISVRSTRRRDVSTNAASAASPAFLRNPRSFFFPRATTAPRGASARARRDGAANVAASLAAVVRRDGFATRDARCDDEIAR